MDRYTATDMVASKPTHQPTLQTLQAYRTAEPLPPAPLNLPEYSQPPRQQPDMVSPPTSGSPTPAPLGVGGLPGYV